MYEENTMLDPKKLLIQEKINIMLSNLNETSVQKSQRDLAIQSNTFDKKTAKDRLACNKHPPESDKFIQCFYDRISQTEAVIPTNKEEEEETPISLEKPTSPSRTDLRNILGSIQAAQIFYKNRETENKDNN